MLPAQARALVESLRAQHELVRRGPKQRDALIQLLNNEDQPAHARMAALGALLPLWNAIARLVVAVIWGPIDRTVCRWAEVTHRGES